MVATALERVERSRNHYELLGLPLFERDQRIIELRVREMIRELRKYQVVPRAEQARRQIELLAKATACLTDPEQKRKYDADLGLELGMPPVLVTSSYGSDGDLIEVLEDRRGPGLGWIIVWLALGAALGLWTAWWLGWW